MIDPKKSADISRKIQDISRAMQTHKSNIDRIGRERDQKARYYEDQIKRERDTLQRLERQHDDLKRQL
jgi:hypothetical protein